MGFGLGRFRGLVFGFRVANKGLGGSGCRACIDE